MAAMFATSKSGQDVVLKPRKSCNMSLCLENISPQTRYFRGYGPTDCEHIKSTRFLALLFHYTTLHSCVSNLDVMTTWLSVIFQKKKNKAGTGHGVGCFRVHKASKRFRQPMYVGTRRANRSKVSEKGIYVKARAMYLRHRCMISVRLRSRSTAMLCTRVNGLR